MARAVERYHVTPNAAQRNAQRNAFCRTLSLLSNAIHDKILTRGNEYPMANNQSATFTSGGVMLSTAKPIATTSGPRASTTSLLVTKLHIAKSSFACFVRASGPCGL